MKYLKAFCRGLGLFLITFGASRMARYLPYGFTSLIVGVILFSLTA